MNILRLLTFVKIIIAPLFLMFSLSALAQSASGRTAAKVEIKPLEVGDTIPETLWEISMPVVNHPSSKSSIRLSDYRDNKLIVLDFWASWCSSCIAIMPRTHSLQNNNEGIVFLPVAYEPQSKIDSFIKSNHITDSLRLFSIVEDKMLSKYFPHQYLPHFVWITTDGIVRAITEAREVNQSNINRMLTSPDATHLTQTYDMDKTQALLAMPDVLKQGVQQYSIFIQGLRREYTAKSFQRTKDDVIYGQCYVNSTLKTMYGSIARQILAKKGIQFNMTKDIVLSVRNPGLLHFSLANFDKRDPNIEVLRDQWELENLYSYDIILPLSKAELLYENILSVLNDSTPYNAHFEKGHVNGKEKYLLVIKDDIKHKKEYNEK